MTQTRVFSHWLWLDSSHSVKNMNRVESPSFLKLTLVEPSHQKSWRESSRGIDLSHAITGSCKNVQKNALYHCFIVENRRYWVCDEFYLFIYGDPNIKPCRLKPVARISQQGGQKPQGGATFFKYNIWCKQPGGTHEMGRRAPLPPPLATALCKLLLLPKVNPDPSLVFHKFFTPDSGPKEKRRNRSRPQCQAKFLTCEISNFTPCVNAQSYILV